MTIEEVLQELRQRVTALLKIVNRSAWHDGAFYGFEEAAKAQENRKAYERM